MALENVLGFRPILQRVVRLISMNVPGQSGCKKQFSSTFAYTTTTAPNLSKPGSRYEKCAFIVTPFLGLQVVKKSF